MAVIALDRRAIPSRRCRPSPPRSLRFNLAAFYRGTVPIIRVNEQRSGAAGVRGSAQHVLQPFAHTDLFP